MKIRLVGQEAFGQQKFISLLLLPNQTVTKHTNKVKYDQKWLKDVTGNVCVLLPSEEK